MVPAWCPLGVCDFCMIVQTNHLAAMIEKTKEIVFKINKTLELWFLWSLLRVLWGRHKPAAGGFCLDLILEFSGRRVALYVIWVTSDARRILARAFSPPRLGWPTTQGVALGYDSADLWSAPTHAPETVMNGHPETL